MVLAKKEKDEYLHVRTVFGIPVVVLRRRQLFVVIFERLFFAAQKNGQAEITCTRLSLLLNLQHDRKDNFVLLVILSGCNHGRASSS